MAQDQYNCLWQSKIIFNCERKISHTSLQYGAALHINFGYRRVMSNYLKAFLPLNICKCCENPDFQQKTMGSAEFSSTTKLPVIAK